MIRAQQADDARGEEAVLRDQFFVGQSVAQIMVTPVCGVALAALLCFGFRERLSGQSSHEERHGRRTRGPELVSAFGWSQIVRANGIHLRLDSKLGPFGPSFRIPRQLEASHVLLMGDTGSGKSNAIRQILRQVEGRGETAIVYDPAGEFVEEFYRPERGDFILNPLDERCPFWHLQRELTDHGIEDAIAAAMLPEKEHEKSFFTDAPRRVLSRLLKEGPSVRGLLDWMADPSEIERLLAGTPQAAYIDRNAGPQRVGVLSSLNLIADSLDLLPTNEDANRVWFDTGEWRFKRTQWVFLTSKPRMRERFRPLHSVWLDLLILRMMEPCANKAKPVWFVLDELASLNKLPQLHTAVTENRKYGNPVVLGFQGRSQLERRYGQDAEAMLSQPATKIFFRTSEPRAAKWISETLGDIEVERLRESQSEGSGIKALFRNKRSYSMEIATKPLVMASEIAGLEPLSGYIKQLNQVISVRFAYVRKRILQPEFIARKMAMPEPRQMPTQVEVVPTAVPVPVVVAQLSKPENPKPKPATRLPQKAAAATSSRASQATLPLLPEPVSTQPLEPEPRRTAFRKKQASRNGDEKTRAWDETRLVD